MQPIGLIEFAYVGSHSYSNFMHTVFVAKGAKLCEMVLLHNNTILEKNVFFSRVNQIQYISTEKLLLSTLPSLLWIEYCISWIIPNGCEHKENASAAPWMKKCYYKTYQVIDSLERLLSIGRCYECQKMTSLKYLWHAGRCLWLPSVNNGALDINILQGRRPCVKKNLCGLFSFSSAMWLVFVR